MAYILLALIFIMPPIILTALVFASDGVRAARRKNLEVKIKRCERKIDHEFVTAKRAMESTCERSLTRS